MKNIGLALLLATSVAVVIDASDRVGVYAVIDKVVFEPNATSPERVQVFGAFAIATPNNRDDYDPVKRGYLYFASSSDRGLTRAEWKDLASLAGTGRIIAFSARFGQSLRVRANSDKPAAPDPYALGTGVHVIQPDRDYAPIKALMPYITR